MFFKLVCNPEIVSPVMAKQIALQRKLLPEPLDNALSFL